MKRYGFKIDHVYGPLLDAIEGGPWVRYEDHAADRAALVAQHEADLQATHREYDRSTAALVAQVAELTRELDEARVYGANAQNTALQQSLDHEREVTRLTEALAAAESQKRGLHTMVEMHSSRAEAAEARVRELDTVNAHLREEWVLAAEWKATAEAYRVDAEVMRDRLAARAEAAEALLDEALTEKYQGSRKAWECVVRHQLARREAIRG